MKIFHPIKATLLGSLLSVALLVGCGKESQTEGSPDKGTGVPAKTKSNPVTPSTVEKPEEKSTISSHVDLKSKTIEMAIRESLKKPTGEITKDDLLSITVLHIRGGGRIHGHVTDVTPLAELKNLKDLKLSLHKITDITPLAKLKHLEKLDLGGNKFTDLSPLLELVNLKELWLTNIHNNFKSPVDFSPLKNLKNLKVLGLGSTMMGRGTDLPVIGELSNLEELDLSASSISDIAPLANLKNLKKLNLGFSGINDLSPLAGLTNLKWLNLGGYYKPIKDVTPLAKLTNLESLSIGVGPGGNKTLSIPDDQKAMLKKALPNCEIRF